MEEKNMKKIITKYTLIIIAIIYIIFITRTCLNQATEIRDLKDLHTTELIKVPIKINIDSSITPTGSSDRAAMYPITIPDRVKIVPIILLEDKSPFVPLKISLNIFMINHHPFFL